MRCGDAVLQPGEHFHQVVQHHSGQTYLKCSAQVWIFQAREYIGKISGPTGLPPF